MKTILLFTLIVGLVLGIRIYPEFQSNHQYQQNHQGWYRYSIFSPSQNYPDQQSQSQPDQDQYPSPFRWRRSRHYPRRNFYGRRYPSDYYPTNRYNSFFSPDQQQSDQQQEEPSTYMDPFDSSNDLFGLFSSPRYQRRYGRYSSPRNYRNGLGQERQLNPSDNQQNNRVKSSSRRKADSKKVSAKRIQILDKSLRDKFEILKQAKLEKVQKNKQNGTNYIVNYVSEEGKNQVKYEFTINKQKKILRITSVKVTKTTKDQNKYSQTTTQLKGSFEQKDWSALSKQLSDK